MPKRWKRDRGDSPPQPQPQPLAPPSRQAGEDLLTSLWGGGDEARPRVEAPSFAAQALSSQRPIGRQQGVWLGLI